MRGRPELFTSYERDQAPLNTPGKRAGLGLLLVALLVFPFVSARCRWAHSWSWWPPCWCSPSASPPS